MTAFDTIKLMNEYCCQFGNPEQLVSDNGTQFCSSNFEQWCRERSIQHTRTVRFHPSSNGQAERFVDTLKRALKKMEGEGTTTEILHTFLEVYRSTPNPNSPRGTTPAESFIGRKMRTIFDALKKTPISPVTRNENMEQQYNSKHGTKSRSFKHGDLVYAREFKNNKSLWVPGEILAKIGNVTYDTFVKVGNHHKIIKAHADQLRHRTSEDSDLNSSSENMLPLDMLLQDFEIPSQLTEDFITPPTSPIINQPSCIIHRRQPVEPVSRSPART